MRECVIVIVRGGVLKQPLIGIKQSHRGRLQVCNDTPSVIANPDISGLSSLAEEHETATLRLYDSLGC
jgi:hypothetical protein